MPQKEQQKMSLLNKNWFKKTDYLITGWMSRNGSLLVRISIGIVFLWFGILKFFPGLSPAQELAINTINLLTFGFLPEICIIKGLAFWEVIIGVGLISGKFMRITLLLLFIQMTGTFSPIFLFPDKVFTHFPYALTLEGQYIIKNLVLLTAGITLGGKLEER